MQAGAGPRPAAVIYRAAGGFAKLTEVTARFMRSAGHGRADCGLPWLNTIVPWPCLRVTVPVFVVKVTSPLSTITPYPLSIGPPQTVVPRTPSVPTGVWIWTFAPLLSSTLPPTNKKAPLVIRTESAPDVKGRGL